MRVAYLVVLTSFLSVPALAAPPVPGFAPKPIPFLKPPAAIHQLYGPPARPVYGPPATHRQHGRSYTSGFFTPYVAYPTAVGGDDARTQAVAAGPAITHNYVWHGRFPIRQGDPGYVTRPAIYDVQQELVRYRPRPHPRGPSK